jgi:hypothetical protein
MVTFDASIILALLEPENCIPKMPESETPVDRFEERIEYLIESLSESGEKIVIPTPALSEILVRADAAGPKYMDIFKRASPFRVVDFDSRAAIQHAAMTRSAIDGGDKKQGSPETWAKIKFDRQIVAIAKVEGCRVIYSDDGGVKTFGEKNGMTVIRISDLPLRPEKPQQELAFPLNAGE